jgi:uncharacterized protein YjbI with pentapeptide repeats
VRVIEAIVMPSQPNQPPGKRPTRAKRLWSAIKASSQWTEKRAIESFANYLDQADIFRIIEKLSPVIEAIGIIAIPLVIWFATQSAQEAKDESEKAARAQEAVKNYLNQLSAVFLDGNLKKDERLRTVTRASTLALLNDPNLDGRHKGQVIGYLTELNLVQIEANDPENLTEEEKSRKPMISLASSNLKDANLSGANLNGANLNRANLSGANFFGAELIGANLIEANLRGAELSGNLIGAKLIGADLRGVDLFAADLRGADLRGARISKGFLFAADLRNADLRNADLEGADLREMKLCKTKLPRSIKLDPNRDCKALGITP